MLVIVSLQQVDIAGPGVDDKRTGNDFEQRYYNEKVEEVLDRARREVRNITELREILVDLFQDDAELQSLLQVSWLE